MFHGLQTGGLRELIVKALDLLSLLSLHDVCDDNLDLPVEVGCINLVALATSVDTCGDYKHRPIIGVAQYNIVWVVTQGTVPFREILSSTMCPKKQLRAWPRLLSLL